MNKNAVIAGFLFLVVLLSSWSLLKPGLFFVHDNLHLARVSEMWQGLSDGHWPVRWSQHFGFGYGLPLFEFYAPLPYVFGALLLGLGLPSVLIIKLLFLVPNLMATLGSYQLGKKLHNPFFGMALSIFYVFAPYRAVNLFVRGAVSESWAMMMFPWILLGSILVLEKVAHGRILLLLSLTTLYLSHNISALIFVPFALFLASGYWLLFQPRKFGLSVMKDFILTNLLSLGLSAFYLIPAILEKEFVQIETLTSDYYKHTNHFLYLRQFVTPFWGYGGSAWGPADGISFFLGYGFLAASVISAITLAVYGLQKVRNNETVVSKELALFGIVSVLSLVSFLMTTEKTTPIWNFISILHFTQFPWRFLSLASFFSSLAVLLALQISLQGRLRFVLIGLLCTGIFIGNIYYFQPNYWLESPTEFYFTNTERMVNELGPTLVEYLPKTFVRSEVVANGTIQLSNQSQNTSLIKIESVLDKVQKKQVRVETSQPLQMVWQTANFPGWTMTLDQQPVPTQTSAEGLLLQDVPAGTHLLELSWRSTPIRAISDTISLLSFIILLWLTSRSVIQKYFVTN